MLYYKKYLWLLLVISVVFIAWLLWPKENLTESSESAQTTHKKVEVEMPIINWTKTYNDWLFVEVYNPNLVSVDVSVISNFMYLGEVQYTTENLYYVSLGPGEKGLLFYLCNIPSHYDFIETGINFYSDSVYDAFEPTRIKEERFRDGLAIDYADKNEAGMTTTVLCYIEDGISGFDYHIGFLENTEHFYDCQNSFNHYEIYENFYR